MTTVVGLGSLVAEIAGDNSGVGSGTFPFIGEPSSSAQDPAVLSPIVSRRGGRIFCPCCDCTPSEWRDILAPIDFRRGGQTLSLDDDLHSESSVSDPASEVNSGIFCMLVLPLVMEVEKLRSRFLLCVVLIAGSGIRDGEAEAESDGDGDGDLESDCIGSVGW